MKWIVFYHNINKDRIETVNIFEHGGFNKEIQSFLKKCKTKEEFAEEARRSLFYYFHTKCEWEVLICPWVGGRATNPMKVDVYWQVMNNWDVFVDYVWSHSRKERI